MKKINLSLTLAFLIIGLTTVSQSAFSKVITTETVFVYEHLSFLKEKSLLRQLSNRKDLVVGHPTHEGFEVYGDENLYKILGDLDIDFKPINFTEKNSLDLKNHPSFEEVEATIQDLVKENNDIMTLENIGDSVQGRPLWLVRITVPNYDHLSLNKDDKMNGLRHLKKHVFYIANIHGNEITGREIMLLLIEDLGKRYHEKDPEITNLLHSTVIHILPSMNPDGAEVRRRANANYVDLNREFPDWTDSEPNTTDRREPEVQAVMEYYKRYDFSFSVNFHGGAEVINYPWDSSPEKGPNEDLLEELSHEYIFNGAEYMMSSYFPSGVTRGYEWYPVYGGLQDWSTHYHDSPHLTIELSNDKWPDFDEMTYFYDNNKNSMIKAMSFF